MTLPNICLVMLDLYFIDLIKSCRCSFRYQVIAGLWALSLVGSCCNILTLLYICKESRCSLLPLRCKIVFIRLIFVSLLETAFVLLHTVPVLYEKYEDQVDAYSEKTWIEIKKQYAVLDEKYLSKIPKGPLKEKKKD